MANTLTSLATAFKYVVDNKLSDLKPNSTIVQDLAGDLKQAEQLGRKFLSPVVLSYELGITYGDGSAFSYNDDIAGVYDEIEVDSNPVVLKSRISLEAAERMAKSEKTMLSHAAMRLGQMKNSLSKFAEVDCLFGRSGIGTISAVSAVNTSPNPDQITITMTDATWAPGIWAGMVGVAVDAYTSGGSKQNSNADMNLVSVDFDNKQIIVSGNNTDLSALQATDILHFKGQKSNSMYGLQYQLDNATTLFGIDAATYDLWKASEFSVGGALTFAKILEGVGKAVAKGGLDEDCVLLVSSKSFEGLNSDVASLRSFDQSYRTEKAELGSRGIKFHCQAGVIEVIAHPMMKEGMAFLFPKKGIRKIGSTDIAFGSPVKQGEIVEHLGSVHAYQVIGRYSFQILINEPAKCVLFTGIS